MQGAAGGNLMDITTMNNTMVNNSQIVGAGASIGSDINVSINNIGGSVGIQNQALCNGVSVSTDPTFASTRNYQECNSADPSSQINATVTNIAGDAAFQGSSLGNSFEADSNAPNMPIWNKQINNGDGGFHGQRQCLQYRRLDQPVLQRHRQYRPDHPLQHQLSPGPAFDEVPRRHPWGKRECRGIREGLGSSLTFLPPLPFASQRC